MRSSVASDVYKRQIVFEIIIADNMPPRKNKSHTLLAVLRVILLSTSSFVAFLPIIFLHVLPLPGIIVLILQMLGVFTLPGTLYLVATPIGNLDDMPPRVAATFGLADFVAAEDTRVTLRLLNHLGLKKPMVSYYEHALQKGEGILRRIEAGAVFVPANVTALRRISWCCAGAAVVCLAAAYIYLPFAFLGVAAAFMALIVRVLKNAFAQAVHMKDELDYTI